MKTVTEDSVPEPIDSASEIPAVHGASWRLAQRVAASEHLAKSEFLPKFLLYICDRKLRGLTQEITEQKIGVRVFNRPADYNPGDDNIVRNYAGQLRKRLDLYFEREGADEEIRISIPRGGYVPVFQKLDVARSIAGELPVSSSNEVPQPVSEQVAGSGSVSSAPVSSAVDEASSRRSDWRMFFLGAAICTLIFSVALLYLYWHHPSPGAQSSHRPFWSEIFAKDRDTFIVPADSAVGILQNLTEQPVSLADYISGKYLSEVKAKGIDSANLEDLRTQRYTSIADINIVAKLARLPEVVPDRFVIRYARDLRMDDLRDSNAILLGAIHTDPWVNLLQEQLNFRFVCESHINHCSIQNTHPVQGEKATYENEAEESSHRTFGVVAFMPNMNRNGRILLVEGLNMASTQASADVLLNDALIRPVLQRATLPNGSIGSFELLIQTTTLGAVPLPSQIIASRFER